MGQPPLLHAAFADKHASGLASAAARARPSFIAWAKRHGQTSLPQRRAVASCALVIHFAELHHRRRPASGLSRLHLQHHLAAHVATLQIAVRRGGLLQWKSTVHHRPQPALRTPPYVLSGAPYCPGRLARGYRMWGDQALDRRIPVRSSVRFPSLVLNPQARNVVVQDHIFLQIF